MITTLTLNPAFDIHVTLDEFLLHHENFAESVTRDIGGKGINISRALTENGIDNLAILLTGSENSTDFVHRLEKVGVNYKAVKCNGRIRENITIHPANGNETRLSFRGFLCNPSHLDEIEKLIDSDGFVTFTGSLPPGITAKQAEVFLMKLKERGAKLVIDSKSVTLEMLRNIKPWLIKPNEEEIQSYFGKMDKKELYKTASALNRDGIENVIISLGENGAILASGGNLYHAYVPEIHAVSTIGAGDSTIAGFIAKNKSPEERLRTAVSFGSAACLREGTKPPLKNDIKNIYKQVIIKAVL